MNPSEICVTKNEIPVNDSIKLLYFEVLFCMFNIMKNLLKLPYSTPAITPIKIKRNKNKK